MTSNSSQIGKSTALNNVSLRLIPVLYSLTFFYQHIARSCESIRPKTWRKIAYSCSRGNTVLTKTMEMVMATKGSAFLEASIGSVIRRICSEKVAIETDPGRSGRNLKHVEKNVDLLIQWCQELWKSIYDAREKCPM